MSVQLGNRVIGNTVITPSIGQDLVDATLQEFSKIESSRTNWETHWDEVAQQVYPDFTDQFLSGGTVTPGGRKNLRVYDSTAPTALNRFAAVMESMLTPRNQTWQRLTINNEQLRKDRSVREWLGDVNRQLFRYRYSTNANFAGQNHQNYLSLGAFGTGCLFIDENRTEPGLRYKAIHLGQIYFVENHQGQIDSAFRKFPMTARQMAQRWGETNISDAAREALNNNQSGREFQVLHCVKPRSDVNTFRLDMFGMPWVSYNIDIASKQMISQGGYNTFPYAISRYVQAPGELYGRSPAMEALPAIKTINEEKKTMLRTGHKNLDPTLLTHDDGIVDTFSLRAGALNPGGVTAEGKPLVHALPVGRLAAGHEMMEIERQHINDAFLVSLFQILTEAPTMTATEVLERVREKGVLLSPTMGRQQSEYLGPLTVRELDVLSRQGLLSPQPPILQEAGGEFDIEYDSPLSRAQRSEEASGLLRTVEMAINVATQAQNPEPLDHFDWDVITPEIAEIQAVPIRWLRNEGAIKKIRQARAQAAQAQQQIEAAPAMAGLAKAAS